MKQNNRKIKEIMTLNKENNEYTELKQYQAVDSGAVEQCKNFRNRLKTSEISSKKF